MTGAGGGSRYTKPVVFAAVALAAGLLYHFFGHLLNFAALADYEADLKRFGRDRPAALVGGAVLIYVAATGLLIPGATLLTLAYGWLFPTVFGFWPGLAVCVGVVSVSSTAGATVAFLLSRYLFGSAVRAKFPDRAAAFDRKFREDGPLYLFTLRLIAGVPFFVVNLVMGLTPIRAWTYWWVSQLGMLPGTLVYCYAGSQFPSLATLAEEGAGGILDWRLGVAFALLGVFPLVVKKLFARFGPRSAGPAAPADSV